jgi:hypothetical protein
MSRSTEIGRLEADNARTEFRGEDPDVPIKEEHKMTVAQVDAELEAHGLTRCERHDLLPWQHLLVYCAR